jgi:hypothetical protein
MENENNLTVLTTADPPIPVMNRRQSLQQGLQLVSQLQSNLLQANTNDVAIEEETKGSNSFLSLSSSSSSTAASTVVDRRLNEEPEGERPKEEETKQLTEPDLQAFLSLSTSSSPSSVDHVEEIESGRRMEKEAKPPTETGMQGLVDYGDDDENDVKNNDDQIHAINNSSEDEYDSEDDDDDDEQEGEQMSDSSSSAFSFQEIISDHEKLVEGRYKRGQDAEKKENENILVVSPEDNEMNSTTNTNEEEGEEEDDDDDIDGLFSLDSSSSLSSRDKEK